MKEKSLNNIWAVALIAAGVLFLAQELGWIGNLSSFFWVAFFAVLSVIFFTTYFTYGVEKWWWLLPAMIFGALAITITMAELGFTGSYVGAPILASIAVPFIVAYGADTRNNWWALIPAWVMGVLTVVVLIADSFAGELVATIVLWGIALPFLFVFLTDRTRWWALIPAGVMGTIGLIPLLSAGLNEDVMGPAIMFLIAMPFVVVYFWSVQNWWALIPAGIMASIGLGILCSLFVPSSSEGAVITGVLFLGWGATFGLLWLRREVQPTKWAKYPAIALACIGLAAFAFGPGSLQYITPIVIIGAGIILLVLSFRRKSAE